MCYNYSMNGKIGNQQERRHFYIGYLLGIIDGEGAYQLSPDKKYYSPVITINNTDDELIDRTAEALRFLAIPYHVWVPKRHSKERRKPKRLYIKGIKRVKRATDVLLEFPSAKRERAKLLNDFCRHRLSIPRKGGNTNQFDTRYSKIEIQFKERLRQLNAKYKGAVSPETIRSASKE